MSRRVKIMIAVPLALVAVLALFAVVGLAARDRLGGFGASQATAERTAGSYGAVDAAEPVTGSDAGTAGKSTSGGIVDTQAIAAAVPPASSPSAHYLLRTGDLSLLIARGTLLSTVDRVRSMTTAMGGYVMSSAVGGGQPQVTATIEPMPLDDQVVSSKDGAQDMPVTLKDPYASLVVRVPEQLFDTALKRFSKLGEVQSVSTSSEDVTSQYVDLRARLRHFRAVERRLIGFLDETTTVNQMLAIQDRIDQVQLTIEELTAQLKSLRETTSYGTLSVFLSEKDATPAAVHASNTFGGTFWNSMRLLGHGARVTGLVFTALVPFLVVFAAIGLVVWVVVRRGRRSRRQAAQPTLPA
jgi:hypothetical protein